MAKPIKHYNKWRIRWINYEGQRKSEVYDSYEEAQYWLEKHKTEAHEAKKGYRQPILSGKSFDDLCEYWLSNRASQKRSYRSDQSIIKQHLRPFFGARQLTDFDESHIDLYKATKRLINKKTLLNQLTLLGSMLKLAQRLRWMANAPLISKPRISIYGSNFRYLKSKQEIDQFLGAATLEGMDTLVLYATAVYTGMRQGELAGLRWTDIDLERRLITVQRSFNGPTKGGDIRYIPILNPLLPILKNWQYQLQTEIVFPNRLGKLHQPSARIFQERFHRVLKAAKLPQLEINNKLKRYITFHDLRHTFSSHWVMNGGDIFKLQKILGHKDIKMTMRYAHLAPDAFSADYGLFGSAPLSPSDKLSAPKQAAIL